MGLAAVYSKIAVLFILLISGYLLAKLKVITNQMVDNFTKFILNIATPSLIINGMMISRTQEKLKEGIILVIMSFCIYGLSLILAKTISSVMNLKDPKKGICEYALMFSNVAFMGFPVIETIFGKQAIFYGAMYNIPFNILAYTVGISLVSAKGSDHKINFKSFIRPGSAAAIIGFIIFALGVPVPGVLKEALAIIGSTTTPISMLMIGAMLSSVPIIEMFNDWQIYVVSVVRVLIIPLLIFIVLKFILQIDSLMLIGVPVIISGMPVAANTAIMTQEYGKEPEIASQCIFTSTLMSIISIPLLSLLFI